MELAAASLPWAIRDRYREEWLHDLAHAEEAGVRRGDIAWAAVRTAITADRMQAPSIAHAILQARRRIDSGGAHLALVVYLTIFALQSVMWGVMPVAILLGLGALTHVVLSAAQIHLASRMVGGLSRFAMPLLLLGLVLIASSLLLPLLMRELPWWSFLVGIGGGACLVGLMLCIEGSKPPKPELTHCLRPPVRRRLLVLGTAIGVAAILLVVLDVVVLVPARWAAMLPIADTWATIAAAGGPASPLAAAGQLIAMMLVPIAISIAVAARWARSERAVLVRTTVGALGGIFVAFVHATTLANMLPFSSDGTQGAAVILPLIAGVLLEITTRQHRDLAPLPPASVPIPPGPWHVTLDGAGAAAAER
ncbi:hypothetical protein AA0Z99_11835 [Agrococcus sp. 1P02AA]|uniref:hypothetical protein n=1 Tax=Agrococcus sp. 1P02AA TaxID=3132259 RepID=UPI0039A43EFF